MLGDDWTIKLPCMILINSGLLSSLLLLKDIVHYLLLFVSLHYQLHPTPPPVPFLTRHILPVDIN